jgi:C4-dicarboxylate-specific signal transduction histidine kinase
LRDALSNLLLNALQATPTAATFVDCFASDGELLISVQDSGPGVPHELREQIWEPFFTTRQRGTGLGLAIVRKRVQEVGGSASLGVRAMARRMFHLAFQLIKISCTRELSQASCVIGVAVRITDFKEM